MKVVLGTDDYIGRRSVRNVEEKESIAAKVLPFIKPNITIYLDSGSTATTLVKIWPDQSNFIFTSGLDCVMESYLKQAVLRQSAEKILLMDSSKTDKKVPFMSAHWRKEVLWFLIRIFRGNFR